MYDYYILFSLIIDNQKIDNTSCKFNIYIMESNEIDFLYLEFDYFKSIKKDISSIALLYNLGSFIIKTPLMKCIYNDKYVIHLELDIQSNFYLNINILERLTIEHAHLKSNDWLNKFYPISTIEYLYKPLICYNKNPPYLICDNTEIIKENLKDKQIICHLYLEYLWIKQNKFGLSCKIADYDIK